MTEITAHERETIRRNALIWERRARELEAQPRFDGDAVAQMLWLGRTDREEIARCRRAAVACRGV